VFASGVPDGVDLAFGPDGNLYVSDWNGGVVRRYNGTTGAFIDVFVHPVNAFNVFGLTFGPDGNLYVAYVTNGGSSVVERFDVTTGASTGSASGGYVYPRDVAVG